MDLTMDTIHVILETVDEYDGTFASAVKQGIKNAVRDYNRQNQIPDDF